MDNASTEREIATIMSGLREIAEMLSHIAAELSSELSPILRAEEPVAMSKEIREKQIRTPLGRDLDAVLGQMRTSFETLASIKERIEL